MLCDETEDYIDYSTQKEWIFPYIDVFQSPSFSNDRLGKKEPKSVFDIMNEIGYEEYKISKRDKLRKRFRRVKGPFPVYIPKEECDEYYDEDTDESFYVYTSTEISHSQNSESEDDQFVGHQALSDAKIKKLQSQVSREFTWNCNVYNIWLARFTKKLKKLYGIDFDPNEDVGVHNGLCTKFLRTFMYIGKFLPAHVLSERYHNLSLQIEKLLNDNSRNTIAIMELIADCFDDADRVVTPLYYTGWKTYM